MANSEFGTGKSVLVIAVVVGCLAILWPKIFYPMMQTAFTMTSPKINPSDGRPFRPPDRPPHTHPGLMNPRMQEGVSENMYGGDKLNLRDGRPFPHPSSRQPVKPQPKSGGAMSIIMPIYTIGIVVFFLYTVLKLVFKKPPDENKKPLIKDYHMDPDYHKFVCEQSVKDSKSRVRERKTCQKPNTEATIDEKSEHVVDEKDYEIYQLKRKLKETESAMERIIKHMGAVNECLQSGFLLKDGNFVCKQHKNGEANLSNSKSDSKTEKTDDITCNPCNNSGNDDTEDDENKIDDAAVYSLQSVKEELENLTEIVKNGSTSCNEESKMNNSSDKSSNDSPQPQMCDSSVNSETSSYEVINQSESVCAITNSLESDKDAENEDLENSVENLSFEADKIYDGDEERISNNVLPTETELEENEVSNDAPVTGKAAHA